MKMKENGRIGWIHIFIVITLTAHYALGDESLHSVRFGYSDEDPPLVALANTSNPQEAPSSIEQYLATNIPKLYAYWRKIADYLEAERNKQNENKRKHCKLVNFRPGQRAWYYWPNRITRDQAALKLKDKERYLVVVITAELEKGRWYRCNTDSKLYYRERHTS